MLWEAEISDDSASATLAALRAGWRDAATKVFVLRGAGIADPKHWYGAHLADLGTPVPLAEDVTMGDRDHQRSGELWFEVRYDPAYPDAYRHSANAQPLHTDGSYIPDFPNATLMTCVASADEGGETVFISAADLVAALRAEAPGLLDELSDAALPHARSGDRRVEPVIDLRREPVLLNWNYYCVDRDASAERHALADRFFAFLQTSPGVQFTLNHQGIERHQGGAHARVSPDFT